MPVPTECNDLLIPCYLYLFSLVTVPLGLHQNTNLSTINHLTGVRSQVWIWLCDYKPFPDVII